MLEGRNFEVRTDHLPLVMPSFRNQIKRSRQVHHLDFVVQFTTSIIHFASLELRTLQLN